MRANLSNWKSKVNKLDADKLVPVPVNLSKLSDVLKNDAVNKGAYNAKVKKIEDKIRDITNLATNTTLSCDPHLGGWGECNFTLTPPTPPHCWFSLNNSEAVKAVTLAF